MNNQNSLTVIPVDASERLYQAIDDSSLATSTKAQYKKAVKNYLADGHTLADAGALATYAGTLCKSSKSFLKAAIKLLTGDLAIQFKAGATPGNVLDVQAALYRIDALNAAITVKAEAGVKPHTWLSQAQVKVMMALPGADGQGLRDWVILGLLVGAGLRREELVNLRFSDLHEQPTKNGTRIVLAVTGKGSKGRLIPIKHVLAERIRQWGVKVGGEFIARSIGRDGKVGESLSVIGAFHLVRKYGALIGIPGLDPHDLRRTYAQLGFEAGVPLTQISKLLGHSSIATTQRYLNLELDLGVTVSDFIPLE